METYIAPYVEVQHAIHLLYATSPRSRDGAVDDAADPEAPLNAGEKPPAAGRPDGDVAEPDQVR
jgi:hypothetical protein